jgi:hypothetical protein
MKKKHGRASGPPEGMPDLTPRLRQRVEGLDQFHELPLLSEAELRERLALLDRFPQLAAWSALASAIAGAARDPRVAACSEARETAEALYALVIGARPWAEIESLLASRRVAARHVDRRDARECARETWQREADAYKRNKSDFARTFARRLLNERGIEVTDRTIREDWLRGLS